MRPSENRIQLWPLFILAVVVVVLMLSVEFKFRLNDSVPQELVRVSAPAAAERNPNTDLARGYWRTAIQVIQYKYPRGTPLPQDPPVEFSLPPEYQRVHNVGSQRAYWNELRRAWENPEVWHRTVSVDIEWPLRAARDVSHFVSNFF